MKKFTKLSLVAAVAVAGLTSNASAGNLAEMVKGVETSGYVRYRNTDVNTENTDGSQTHEYKIVLDNKIKVNDSVTANVKAVMVSGKTSRKGDDSASQADHDFDVSRANFTYTGPVTATYGIQGYNVPMTNDAEAQGLKVSGKVAGITLVAATFNAGLADATQDLRAYAAVIPAGPVTLTAAQATMADAKITHTAGEAKAAEAQGKESKSTYVNAKAKVANVSLSATSADLKVDDGTNQGIDFVTASTDVAGFGVTLGYAKTDKNGGNTALADGKAGDRTATNFALIYANAGDFKDAKATLISVSKSVGPVALTLAKVDADPAVAADGASETVVKAAYAMSKNFTVSGFVSEVDYDKAGEADVTKTRLEVKYSF